MAQCLPDFQMSRTSLHHLCPQLLVQLLLGTPLFAAHFPKQPGHSAVRPYLSKMFCGYNTIFARLSLSHSSFCWIVGFCCVLIPVAFHGLPSHKFKICKSSHTACLHCTFWRREFIGVVKLADKNSSHPPHVQLGSILRMVSLQTHFSNCHNLSSVVLAPDTNGKAFSRFPSLQHCLQPMHNVVPSNPSTRDPVQLLSCISLRRLLEIPEAVPEWSNSLVIHDPSSLSNQSQSELWIDTT